MGQLLAAVAIPGAILLLLAGTVAFVVLLTLAARVVDRLWPQPREERASGSQRARSVARRPRSIRLSPFAATMVAAAALLAAAWSVALFAWVRGLT